jgi:hypothetical protein
LGHNGYIGSQRMPGGEQPAVHGDGFEVAAERLAGGDHAGEVAFEVGERTREPGGQGPTVGHHVRHPRVRPHRPYAGEDSGQRGVQIGEDYGHAVQGIGRHQQIAVRRDLFVGCHRDHLQRGIAGLHDVARPGRVGWQPVGDRDDEGVPAGAEVLRQGAGVEQHAVAGLGLADESGIGERVDRAIAHQDPQFERAAPPPAQRLDLTGAPCDHGDTLVGSRSLTAQRANHAQAIPARAWGYRSRTERHRP